MRTDYAHLEYFNGEPVSHETPVDVLEPIEQPADQIRDARIAAIKILNQAFSTLDAALSAQNATVLDGLRALWAVAFALGLNMCSGRSMTAVAERLGCVKATLSKSAVSFCSANNLPPSNYLKAEESRLSYAKARRRSVQLNG